MQEHLESIYGIRCELRAHDFLVDEEAARRLGGTGGRAEELLVREDGGDLEVALFLSRDVLDRLRVLRTASADALLGEELPAYCQLAEGVSHFLYLAHTAALSRTVSLLELEAQAEIDKFATCALMRWREGGSWAEALIGRLFDRVEYLPVLSPAERWRYEEANRLARGYCVRLIPLIAARRMDRLIGELRYSYRLGAEAKLRYLGG